MNAVSIAIWTPGRSSECVSRTNEEADTLIEDIDNMAEESGYAYCFWVLVDRDPPICGIAKDLEKMLDLCESMTKVMEAEGYHPVCEDSIAAGILELTKPTLH